MSEEGEMGSRGIIHCRHEDVGIGKEREEEGSDIELVDMEANRQSR